MQRRSSGRRSGFVLLTVLAGMTLSMPGLIWYASDRGAAEAVPARQQQVRDAPKKQAEKEDADADDAAADRKQQKKKQQQAQNRKRAARRQPIRIRVKANAGGNGGGQILVKKITVTTSADGNAVVIEQDAPEDVADGDGQ